jgi:23S rRNA pseudouridine1911/1915/1917 synthase
MAEDYINELDDSLDDIEPVERTSELYEHFRVVVDKGQTPVRIDKYLFERIVNASRNRIQTAADAGFVMANGKPVKSSYKVKPLDVLTVMMDRPRYENDIIPEDIPLDILYEDDDLLVVNKPKGMVVHPSAGHYSGTLVNAIMYHCKDSLSGINGEIRPGIVHRIDMDTTGSLIVCKNDESHVFIAEQIKEHSVNRRYRGIVYGVVRDDEGTIHAPIGRHPVDRKKMAINEKNGKDAITHYKVLERFDKYTYMEFKLETGRTHQIRVHMASIGHPLLGDTLYSNGKSPYKLQGQTLHAMTIGFIHPGTREYMEISAPLPEYFEKILRDLR